MSEYLGLHGLGGGGGNGSTRFNPLVLTNYVRDVAYLPLPTLSVSDEKFVGLFVVMPTGGYVSFSCSGSFSVDWGDGTTNNYNSGNTANHTYSYNSINSPVTAKGYKQVLITVTPRSGAKLTAMNLNMKHSSASGPSSHTSGWVDIVASLPNCTTFTMSAASPNIFHRLLEKFSLIKSKVTSFTRFFAYCSSLAEVTALDVSSGNAFTYMFYQCSNLQKVPYLTISNVGSIAYMFYQCFRLKDASMSLGGVTNMDYTFYQCTALYYAPNLSTFFCKSFSNTFAFCVNLETIAALDLNSSTGGGSNTNIFLGCTSLSNPNLGNVSNDLSLSGCDLSKSAILAIFYNLKTVSKTIDLRNVWGAAMLDANDRSVATSRNWTITG